MFWGLPIGLLGYVASTVAALGFVDSYPNTVVMQDTHVSTDC